MIRFGHCPVCGASVELKPKARVDSSCSLECKKIRAKARIARYEKTDKAVARTARYEAKGKRPAITARWRRKHGAAWAKKYREQNPSARIAISLRARIGNVLSGRKKSAPTLAYLGCSKQELRSHLESKFKPGMSWENYGRLGWHIDHKRPLASFDLVLADGTINEQALREAMHFSNLQPLWYWENISKADNYVA